MGHHLWHAVEARQRKPPVPRPQVGRENQWTVGVGAQHRRGPSASLHRCRCFVEQPCPPQPRHQLGGPARAESETLRGGRARDARLGTDHVDELRGAQPPRLCGLPWILCHRRSVFHLNKIGERVYCES